MSSPEVTRVTMYEPYHHTIANGLGYTPEQLNFRTADGGHMAYKRLFIEVPGVQKTYFIKGQDSAMFTDAEREDHALQYLKKEQMLFDYLRSQGYQSIPEETGLIDNSYLVMQGLLKDEGWYWRAPRDNPELFDQYVQSVLASYDALQAIPLPDESYFFPKRIMKVFMDEGWDNLSSDQIDKIRQTSQLLRPKLYPETDAVLDEVLATLPSLVPVGQALYDTMRPHYLTHHDARQANIAWHPEFGTKNIDLSWVDIGWKNADATMFLIDLAKAGHNVSPYIDEYFNPDHALLLMGHWIGRSAEPTRDGNPIVRLHQLASALTAYSLLKQTNTLN